MPELGVGALAVLAVGAAVAGAVNAVAGGGSLISFPALLVVGFPALTANITNTVALAPGYVGGTIGYRSELRGQRRRIIALSAVSVGGALVGSFLLLVSSPALFDRIVPALILSACGLLAAQERLHRFVQNRGPEPQPGDGEPSSSTSAPLLIGHFVASVYGAYFGAGLGIMMLALLAIFISDTLQRLNALKGAMSLVINAVGAAYFALFANVAWSAVAVMAAASLIGGHAGVGLARRLDDRRLRRLVIAFGVCVALALMFTA